MYVADVFLCLAVMVLENVYECLLLWEITFTFKHYNINKLTNYTILHLWKFVLGLLKSGLEGVWCRFYWKQALQELFSGAQWWFNTFATRSEAEIMWVKFSDVFCSLLYHRETKCGSLIWILIFRDKAAKKKSAEC